MGTVPLYQTSERKQILYHLLYIAQSYDRIITIKIIYRASPIEPPALEFYELLVNIIWK